MPVQTKPKRPKLQSYDVTLTVPMRAYDPEHAKELVIDLLGQVVRGETRWELASFIEHVRERQDTV